MEKIKPLDMKDIAIIDAFPVYRHRRIILNVGCGDGRIDYHLALAGYRVYATDIAKLYDYNWKSDDNLTFHISNIFDFASFPIQSAPIVICSQVLEHLKDYKSALANLIILAKVRLIITFPYRRSFRSPSHCNFWDDRPSEEFKDVHEFIELCEPHSVSISKIRTKSKDAGTDKYDYLTIMDKRQNLMNPERK